MKMEIGQMRTGIKSVVRNVIALGHRAIPIGGVDLPVHFGSMTVRNTVCIAIVFVHLQAGTQSLV
jgi:hypothetical protein